MVVFNTGNMGREREIKHIRAFEWYHCLQLLPPLPGSGRMDELATFEDLSIDDSLGIVERVLRYATSNIALQRLVIVEEMMAMMMVGDIAKTLCC